MEYDMRRFINILSSILFFALAPGAVFANAYDVKTFKPWPGYATLNGEWIQLDFDGDGRKDMIHQIAGADTVHSWRSVGDGSYTVGTFRPWAGYAMANGLWFAGDINGDGKDDLVHAVANSDYIHTWTSSGDGTFRVGTFRPWTGYAIPNGNWRMLDLNGDGRQDLVHLVGQRDYVHTWMSNGDGTFTIGTYRPWDGYGMSGGVWMAGDINGDGKADLVHAVASTDYVHTWMSNGDGSFTVGTFRPWAGYAIPNGNWRMLDLNGDGRQDIVHLVGRGDYVHTWMSNGNGAFSIGTFRPWAGYAMPRGQWVVGDLNGDGKDDLFHAVENSSYAHSWLSNGDGNFQVGTFNPWPGYAVTNGLWFAGDLSGDGKADVLHVVANSNGAHPWISNLPTQNEFGLEGVEVTQAIQDMPHSIALVSGKATAVRVYPMLNASTPRKVRGQLYVRNVEGTGWEQLASTNAVTVSPAQNFALRTKRETTDLGLNFMVPATHLNGGWLAAGYVTLTDAATGANLPCSGCWTLGRIMPMGDANPMRVRVLGLNYSAGLPAANFAPTATDFSLMRSWLRRVYPTGDLRITTGTVNANATAPFGCGDANAQMTAIRNADIAGGADRRTHYYGLVADGNFFMRGCSASIPASANPGVVASGPTGPGTFGWDTDGSYGDWYTGHELGHTYGRLHIGSGCGETSDDSNYPYTSGRISGDDGTFVGFDTGDAGNGISARALPGRDWSDVMSYCANQWISNYTYNATRARLVAENALAAGPEPLLAGMRGAVPELSGLSDVIEGAAPSPYDLAEQGGPVPSQTQPNDISAAAEAAPDVPEPSMSEPPVPLVGGVNPGEMPAVGTPDTPAVAAPDAGPAVTPTEVESVPMEPETAVGADLRQGDYLALAASVNLTRGTAKIVDARRVGLGLVSAGLSDDRLVLVARNADGQEIARFNAPFRQNSDIEPGADVVGVLDAVVDFPEGMASVDVLVNGVLADTFEAPQSGATPDVSASIAASGARQANGMVTLMLDSAGTTAPGVTFDVQASTDGGTSWLTVAVGLASGANDIELSGLGAEGEIQLRVVTKEGFEQRVVDTLTITP